MRCFLICTHSGDFWPVEEIFNEGGLQQAIELHVDLYDETHYDQIRVFFPEMPTELLEEGELIRLAGFRKDLNDPENIEFYGEYERPSLGVAKEILDIYENSHS